MTKFKAQKQRKGKSPKERLLWFIWVSIPLAIIAIVAVVYASPAGKEFGSDQSDEIKAAIVDQLCSLQPNQAFIEKTTRYLEDYGFQVDVYQGDEVTTDFYRKLPSYRYNFIIFRVHSGLLSGEDVADTTWLFTSEPYSQTRYVAEQLTKQVTFARPNKGNPLVFAISAKFITQSMEDQFTDTAIIMMGCDGLYSEDVAHSFVQKGASTYIAWDASVMLDYVDGATSVLIEKLCSDKLIVKEAVAQTMCEKGRDPKHSSVLMYYPLETGDKTIRQLIE